MAAVPRGVRDVVLRYYDPAAGRFVSRDPLGLWGDASQNGNGQGYCGHDPVNRVDPYGDWSPLADWVNENAPWVNEIGAAIWSPAGWLINKDPAPTRGPVAPQPGTPTPAPIPGIGGLGLPDAPKVFDAWYWNAEDEAEACELYKDQVNLIFAWLAFDSMWAETIRLVRQAEALARQANIEKFKKIGGTRTRKSKSENIDRDLTPEEMDEIRGGGEGAKPKRWKTGDPVLQPTSAGKTPAWNTQKGRYWKNEASKPGAAEKWGEDNVKRMKEGSAPQRYNADKGGMESMELSHEPIPQREGGNEVVPRWPQDHAAVDPFRRPGY